MPSTAVVAQFFTTLPSGIRKCKQCLKTFSKNSGNSTLESHLRSFHPLRHKELEEKKAVRAKEKEEQKRERSKKRRLETARSGSTSSSSTVSAMFGKVSAGVDDVHEAAARLFASQSLSHRLIDTPEFDQFVSALRNCPTGKLPDRKQLRSAILRSGKRTHGDVHVYLSTNQKVPCQLFTSAGGYCTHGWVDQYTTQQSAQLVVVFRGQVVF